jgi:hypothetical protein
MPTSSRSDRATASQDFGRNSGGEVRRGVAIIQGHPEAGERHLCHGLADAYAEGVQRAKGNRRFDISVVDHAARG